MPTYVYKCLECAQQFDVQQSFTDATLTESTCPNCGTTRPVRKVFTPVGVTFKGSGFYKTDSRGSSSKTASAAPSSGDSGSSSAPAASGDSSSSSSSSGSGDSSSSSSTSNGSGTSSSTAPSSTTS